MLTLLFVVGFGENDDTECDIACAAERDTAFSVTRRVMLVIFCDAVGGISLSLKTSAF